MRIEECVDDALPSEFKGWPGTATLILSALETGAAPQLDRRALGRIPYHVQATLRLFSGEAGENPRVLYTRDINPRGLGFITTRSLPVGHGGLLSVTTPDGQIYEIHCTVTRFRVLLADWYEGGLKFRPEQPQFSPEHFRALSASPRALDSERQVDRKRPSRILIVDDDEQIAHLIRMVLEREGYLCTTACTGTQGMDRFAREEPNLIITDLRMPMGDGVTLMETVRRTSGVPIIVFSGLLSEYNPWPHRFEDVRLLPKPISIRSLLSAVKTALLE